MSFPSFVHTLNASSSSSSNSSWTLMSSLNFSSSIWSYMKNIILSNMISQFQLYNLKLQIFSQHSRQCTIIVKARYLYKAWILWHYNEKIMKKEHDTSNISAWKVLKISKIIYKWSTYKLKQCTCTVKLLFSMIAK